MPMEFKRNRMKQQTPPIALKTCWDGSVIPENQTCPMKPVEQQMQQLMGGTQRPTFNKNKNKVK